jgi:hypothetical protein
MSWAGHVARIGEESVWWESEKKRDNWEDKGVDGIRMDLRKIGWGSVALIQLPQDRGWWRTVVNTVINLRVLAPRN